MIEENIQNRAAFLRAIYIAAAGVPHRKVPLAPICEELGLTPEDAANFWRQLSGRKLVESAMHGNTLALTSEGAKHVEETHMSGIEEKRFRFLAAIYDASGANPLQAVSVEDAAKASGIQSKEELVAINSYLKSSGLTDGPLGLVKVRITSQGIDEVESKRKDPESPTQHFNINVGDVYGNVSNIMGHGNTVNQTATVTMEQAITRLEEDLRQLDGGELSPQSKRLVTALKADDPVETTLAASEVAKAGPNWLAKLKDFASRAGSSAAGGAAVLAVKAILAAHGVAL